MTVQAHIVGARPNFMKAGPVLRACIDRGSPQLVIHTGQHYDTSLSDVFFEQLGLPEPDLNLGVGSGTQARQTAALMIELETAFQEMAPDRVVVYGDVNSTLAAALVASKLDIEVAHVEAGLRSFDRTMPEEINRLVADSLSSLHFVTSAEAVGHLAREGIPQSGIHFVGNPMIDTLLRFRSALTPGASRLLGVDRPYGMVTLHRPSNVDDVEVARALVDGLLGVSELMPLVIPVHPRGREVLASLGLRESDRVTITEPLGYLEFMSLLSEATLVLTDSGGVQEETTVLGVPCLTLRENTERPITIEMGTNRLIPRNRDGMVEAARDTIANPPTGAVPPLWDGRAGDRIAQILLDTPAQGVASVD